MTIEISNGELIDKLTILELKLDKVKDTVQADNILKEWELLSDKVNLLFSVHSSQKLFKAQSDLEEINRQLTARITDVHFAPTPTAAENLRNESLLEADIVVTGNTVIDALYESVELLKGYNSEFITVISQKLSGFNKMILVTGHRRENHGDGFVRICEALDEIASLHPNVLIVYPVHFPRKRKRR